MSQVFRESVVWNLKKALLQSSLFQAAWLGGSAATKREDEHSDTDLVLITNENNVQEAFSFLEKVISVKWKITHTWNIGHNQTLQYHQKFYAISPAPPFYYLDIVIFSNTDPKFYGEYYNHARHGIPVILFDKNEILKHASGNVIFQKHHPIDWANTEAQFEIMYRTFLKEVERKKYIDSYTFYMRLVHILVANLRSIHTPERPDFGLRYLYSDLPTADAEFIENLLKVSDFQTMKGNVLKIKEKIHKNKTLFSR